MLRAAARGAYVAAAPAWRLQAARGLAAGRPRGLAIPEPGTPEFQELVEREVHRELFPPPPPRKVKPQKKKAVLLSERRKWRITTGDRVMVNRGHPAEKGKVGVVKKVIRKEDKVIVENVNVQRVEYFDEASFSPKEVHEEVPIPYGSVNLIDPEDGRPTRIRTGFLADGTKVRVSTRSGQIIPYPPRNYVRDSTVYETDTPADSVLARSFEKR